MKGYIVILSIAVALVIILHSYGCTKQQDISGYGITLKKESTPEEVAELLISGLDHEDEELLKKLVAVKYAKEDIDSIFRKRLRKSDVTYDQAAGFAVDGWIMTYTFCSKGETRIISTTIDGDKATVIASGRYRSTGESNRIRIDLRREEGWWKVQHGINIL